MTQPDHDGGPAFTGDPAPAAPATDVVLSPTPPADAPEPAAADVEASPAMSHAGDRLDEAASDENADDTRAKDRSGEDTDIPDAAADLADALPAPAADTAASTTPANEPPLVEDLPPPAPPAPAPEEIPPPPGVSDLPPAELRSVVEGLLFVSHRPLTVARLAACLPGVDPLYLDGFLAGLAERFTAERRGWELRREANGWQLMTRTEHHPWVRQLERRELPTKLTKGAMETLAVVAYKQPVTRGAIEDIRGVQCGPVLRQLMDLRLVQVSGREEGTLGRPLLYGTTDHFLQRFGLGSLNDLPRRHEMGA